MNIKPILILAGEPYSVFSEILFKTLIKYKSKNPIILIGSKTLYQEQMLYLKYKFKFNEILLNEYNSNSLKKNMINIIDVKLNYKKPFNSISDKSNLYLKNMFNIGLEFAKKFPIAGLINGPISKKNFLKKKFLGVTEYLANKTKTSNYAMLIYNKDLSVCPLTTHLPIKIINNKITIKEIITKIKLIKEFYKKKFNKDVSIAITGLNPHCESNYTSSEEKKIILPAIKKLKKNYTKVYGPYAADSLFMSVNRKKFDVVLGMYHDQVLTPMKSIYNFNAINITLGLPFLRISPDHGPNFSMIGKNKSNPNSLIAAFKFLDQ